jgi:hypothetical protein
LQRVLTADPGNTGVMRPCRRGYEEALEVARQQGIDRPMVDSNQESGNESGNKNITPNPPINIHQSTTNPTSKIAKINHNFRPRTT